MKPHMLDKADLAAEERDKEELDKKLIQPIMRTHRRTLPAIVSDIERYIECRTGLRRDRPDGKHPPTFK